MLDDLFSHKIHVKDDLDAWMRSLVRLASIFMRFDGRVFNHTEFDNALRVLAPTARRSPFRDQYSIYLSLLGVGQIVRTGDEWVCRISETARTFLTGVEPDVAAFCRLQLALYQRPDGRGQQYSGDGHVEHKSARKTLELIRRGYRVFPFRLILRMFLAKARENNITEDEVRLTPEEIYAIANAEEIRSSPTPEIDLLRAGLRDFARGRLKSPQIKRKTFAFLEATGLISVGPRGTLSLMPCPTREQQDTRDRQIQAIRDLPPTLFYRALDDARNADDLATILSTGEWAEHFDAVKKIPAKALGAIVGPAQGELVLQTPALAIVQEPQLASPVVRVPRPERPTPQEFGPMRPARRPFRVAAVTADPEETRVKRERRNAYHDLILRLIAERVRNLRLIPNYTENIDLFTNIEDVGGTLGGRFSINGSFLENQDLPYFPDSARRGLTFLFEAKSSDDEIVLPQVRRAVSQLYEYRFLDRENLNPHVVLVIALQAEFAAFPWLRDYLLRDRHIAVCWLDSNLQRLLCPRECYPILGAFVDGVA
jgi:hypothetical protein